MHWYLVRIVCKEDTKKGVPIYAIVGLHGWQPSGTTYFTQDKTKKGDNHGDSCRTSFADFECSWKPELLNGPKLSNIYISKPQRACTAVLGPFDRWTVAVDLVPKQRRQEKLNILP